MFREKLAGFVGLKAMYIALVSVLIGAATVGGTVAIVRHNRPKQDFIPVETSENTSENGSEATDAVVVDTVDTSASKDAISVSEADKGKSSLSEKDTVAEPAGDKALQYIKEYDKLTEEYERKKAELEAETSAPNWDKVYKPMSIVRDWHETDEEYSLRQVQLEKENESCRIEWESESASVETQKEKADNSKKQLKQLEARYFQDVSALKARYGI